MKQDAFFTEADSSDPWGSPTTQLRTDLLNQLRAGPVVGIDDLEAATALVTLVWDELQAYGTSGGQRLSDDEIALAQRALTTTLSRVGIELDLPWRNFTTFRSHWLRHGCTGSWQARRDLLEEFFEPVRLELDRQEEAQFRANLADPVSPHSKTGWPKVDEELDELRRRFRTATTTQDYRDVGNRSVAVLEALSRTVYNPAQHLREGESEPTVDKTKQRIGRYVEDSLAGKDNESVRGVANKVIELAHSIKHSPAPTRRDAGIAADSVVMLANILRRVDQDF